MPQFSAYTGSCHCTDCHNGLVEGTGYCLCDQFQADHPVRYEEALAEAQRLDDNRVGRTDEAFDGYIAECACPWCTAWREYVDATEYGFNFDTFVERNRVVDIPLERTVQNLCRICDTLHASKGRSGTDAERTYLFCTQCYRAGSIAHCPDCGVYGHTLINAGRNRVTETTFPASSQEGWPEESPCALCLDDHDTQTCVACDRTVVMDMHDDYAICDISDNLYCANCQEDALAECCQCRCTLEWDLTTNVNNVGAVCEDCRDNEFEFCDDCSQYFRDDCSCVNDLIRRYTHRPEPIFLFVPSQERADNTVFFGVELEMENGGNVSNGRAALNIRDSFLSAMLAVDDTYDTDVNLLYFKNDSSVRNGFEIVSHPFSWSFLKKHHAAFESIFDAAKDASMERQDNCGMHVHISKDRFTRLEVYKLVRFLYGNPFFTERMSNRREDRFRACASVYGESKKDLLEKSRAKRGGGRNCLNLNPANSMELRLFDSVGSYDCFMRNMEFCESLCRFVKVSSLKNLWPNLYMDYVSKHSKTFPRVDTFLQNTLF